MAVLISFFFLILIFVLVMNALDWYSDKQYRKWTGANRDKRP